MVPQKERILRRKTVNAVDGVPEGFHQLPGYDLPANALDVVIHGNGQLVATASAAALEHIAPVLSLHASAKTMYAQPSMNLGLISPLWHYNFPFSK